MPSVSNFITAGAALQHLVCGGFAIAPFSSSSSEAGRCRIQTWSFWSTAMPDTWPRIQFSGSGFGQNGSGRNCGASCANAGDANAVSSAMMIRMALSRWSVCGADLRAS